MCVYTERAGTAHARHLFDLTHEARRHTAVLETVGNGQTVYDHVIAPVRNPLPFLDMGIVRVGAENNGPAGNDRIGFAHDITGPGFYIGEDRVSVGVSVLPLVYAEPAHLALCLRYYAAYGFDIVIC